MRAQTAVMASFILAAASMVALPARAQDPQDQSQQQDQAQAVARVSYVHGDVSTQRGDSGDWNAATLNTPVVAGDRISTGAGARAEIQLDWGNVIRLDEGTVIRVADLSNGRIQVEVAQGLVSYNGPKGSGASIEIDTPNVSVYPRRDGVYRIQVNSEETFVAVREGEAEVGTPQGTQTVRSGQLISVRGDANSAQYRVTDAPGNDGWDKWNSERNQVIDRAQSWQHVNRYYQGAADLDSYGTWRTVPDYGPVWVPSVAPGWVPYSEGSWLWEPYWGWTWVSYEPWGWAPYHYGRWFLWGGSWAWWPGPVRPFYRPVWAPAYVSFFGFGHHGGWGVSFGFGGGFGSIGWLPIGPGDPFRPWWGGARFGVVSVGGFNTFHGGRVVAPLAPAGHGRVVYSNLGGVTSNAGIRAGLVTVPAQSFGRGRVQPMRGRLGEDAIRQAQVLTGSVPVVPGRESLRATDRAPGASSVPSRNLDSQRFFSRGRTSSPAAPRNFEQQASQFRQQLEQQHAPVISAPARTSGQPNAGFGVRQGATGSVAPEPRGAPNRGAAVQPQRNQAAAPDAGSGGWRTFNGNRPPAGAEQARPQVQQRGGQPAAPDVRPQQNSSESRGGWRSFTPPPQSDTQRGTPRGPAGPPQSYRSSGRAESREPLNLRKPVISDNVPYRNSARGNESAAPRAYSAEPRGYSAAPQPQPSFRTQEAPRGNASAPRGYSGEPRGYSSAPRYSAPSAPRGDSRGGSGGSRGGSSHSSSSSHGGRPR